MNYLNISKTNSVTNFIYYFIVILFLVIPSASYAGVCVSCAGYSEWTSGGQSVGYKTYNNKLYYNSCNGCWDGANEPPSYGKSNWSYIGDCSNDPAVTTDAASSITNSSMTLNGTVNNSGPTAVIERGFIYGTSSADVTSSTTALLSGSSVKVIVTTGTFSKSIINLCPGTTYYFKAYATNSSGTGYGSDVLNGLTTLPGTYTTVQNGSLSDPATWGGCGPPSLTIGNNIIINHTVSSAGLTLENGTDIIVNSGGQLNSSGTIETKNTGAANTLTISGTVSASGLITSQNTGLVINSGGNLNISGTFKTVATTVTINGTVTSGTLNVTDGSNITINSAASLTNSGTLTFSGTTGSNSLTVNSGGTFSTNNVIYNSAATLTNIGTTNITNELQINAVGNFITSGTATIGSIDNNNGDFTQTGGSVTVSGNYDCANDCDYNQTSGSMTVGGDFIVWGSGESHMSGTLGVSGSVTILNNGYMDGSGTLTYNLINVNPANSSAYIACTNGMRFDTNSSSGAGYNNYFDVLASPWNLGDCKGGTLPFAFNNFSVKITQEGNLLEWSGDFSNSKNIQIESSFDAVHFEMIENISLQNIQDIHFEYFDNNFSNLPITYYRLKGISYGGTVFYSDIEFSNNTLHTIESIVPMPVTNESFTLYSKFNDFEYEIIDQTSRVLMNGHGNSYAENIDVSNLQNGQYYLKLNYENTNNILRFIISR